VFNHEYGSPVDLHFQQSERHILGRESVYLTGNKYKKNSSHIKLSHKPCRRQGRAGHRFLAGVERAPADLAQIWSAGYVVSLDGISLDHVRNDD
jgi:hypothetical protein